VLGGGRVLAAPSAETADAFLGGVGDLLERLVQLVLLVELRELLQVCPHEIFYLLHHLDEIILSFTRVVVVAVSRHAVVYAQQVWVVSEDAG